MLYLSACADPGIFVRGGGGGGGGPGQSDKKKSSDVLFFSPQRILQKSNGQFQRNLSFLFFKVPEGVHIFQGGGGVSDFSGEWGPIAYSL